MRKQHRYTYLDYRALEKRCASKKSPKIWRYFLLFLVYKSSLKSIFSKANWTTAWLGSTAWMWNLSAIYTDESTKTSLQNERRLWGARQARPPQKTWKLYWLLDQSWSKLPLAITFSGKAGETKQPHSLPVLSNPRSSPLIFSLICLDEIDQLQEKCASALARAFEWPMLPGSNVILIGKEIYLFCVCCALHRLLCRNRQFVRLDGPLLEEARYKRRQQAKTAPFSPLRYGWSCRYSERPASWGKRHYLTLQYKRYSLKRLFSVCGYYASSSNGTLRPEMRCCRWRRPESFSHLQNRRWTCCFRQIRRYVHCYKGHFGDRDFVRRQSHPPSFSWRHSITKVSFQVFLLQRLLGLGRSAVHLKCWRLCKTCMPRRYGIRITSLYRCNKNCCSQLHFRWRNLVGSSIPSRRYERVHCPLFRPL